MDSEKRERNRANFKTTVSLNVDGQKYAGECTDISMNGMSIIVGEEFPIGTKGTADIIHTFGEQSLSIASPFEVVRISKHPKFDKKHEIGIHFQNMDSDSSLELFRVIRNQGTV
jgi:c-di-GMP-binding flagellar brake protein YcgR